MYRDGDLVVWNGKYNEEKSMPKNISKALWLYNKACTLGDNNACKSYKKLLLSSTSNTIVNRNKDKPSWCKNTKSYVEKRICLQPELLSLDTKLFNTYQTLKNKMIKSKKDILIREQLSWVDMVNLSCNGKDDNCIQEFYKKRIIDFNTGTIY